MPTPFGYFLRQRQLSEWWVWLMEPASAPLTCKLDDLGRSVHCTSVSPPVKGV